MAANTDRRYTNDVWLVLHINSPYWRDDVREDPLTTVPMTLAQVIDREPLVFINGTTLEWSGVNWMERVDVEFVEAPR